MVILGAGLAGLAAGVHLAARGLKPLLLEAAPAPGGRARSFFDSRLGEWVDNGPHVLIGACDETLRLLRMTGAEGMLWDPGRVRLDFWTRQEGFHQLACPHWPAPLHLLAGVWRFAPLGAAERRAALRLGWALARGRRPRPGRTVTHWLQDHGQGTALLQRLWGPLCLAALNEPPASADAGLFFDLLRRAFFQDAKAARLLVPRLPLSQGLIAPAVDFIAARGGRILTRRRVVGLERSDGGVSAALVAGGRRYAGKVVICALPPWALGRIAPPDWTAIGGGLQFAPIVSVHLNYPADRPPGLPGVGEAALREGAGASNIPGRDLPEGSGSPEAGATHRESRGPDVHGPRVAESFPHPCQLSGQLPAPLVGLPFGVGQWLVDRGFLAADPAGSGARLSAVISGAYRELHWSAEKIVQTVDQEVAALVPGLARLRPRARVVREARATFAPWPGCEAERPGPQTPLANLFLAGDWTGTGLPATLESAVMSGRRAAELAAGRLA